MQACSYSQQSCLVVSNDVGFCYWKGNQSLNILVSHIKRFAGIYSYSENPTGAVYFEGKNKLAQVVVVRTVRSFQTM
jgi:hypothetical protein